MVVLHRLDIAIARHRDAIFSALQLRHQVAKQRIGFELRVVLGHHQELGQRAGEFALRGLEFRERSGIVDEFRRRLDAADLGAGIGDTEQHVFFLLRKPLHRIDEVGYQIGTALVLVQDLGPARLDLLIIGLDRIVTAIGKAQRRQRRQHGPQSAHRKSPVTIFRQVAAKYPQGIRTFRPGKPLKGRLGGYFAADGSCLSFAEIVNMTTPIMRGPMTAFETIIVERPDPRIARIVMNRPEARNAQNLQMTYELNTDFDDAVQDDAVKVIILAGSGPHFSAGHDLRPGAKNTAGVDFPPVGNWGGFAEANAHGRFAREQEIYLQITRRWRNLAKPTIAEVHGKCIAGGVMLAWACALIAASHDAEFCDPVVTMGVCGVEWFVHPWELGPRKAKEFLFTADAWSTEEAHRLGMVNHVVPRAELSSFVMTLAQKIAAKPSFALKLTKEAVNRSVDVMGQPAAIDQAFALHQLCHAHNLQEFGMVVDPAGLHPSVRKPATAK